MPFGLCTAPYIFTKILKRIAQRLGEKKIIIVIYLDDVLIIARSEIECRQNIELVKDLLEYVGLVINIENYVLEPAKACKFFGFNINSHTFTIELPDDKRKADQDL